MVNGDPKARAVSFFIDGNDPTLLPLIGDGFSLLPILMGASSLWMSSMTPVSPQMDPVQQKMMKYMMIFMGFIFFKVPSGLCVYFITSSIWGIIEGVMILTGSIATDANGVPLKG